MNIKDIITLFLFAGLTLSCDNCQTSDYEKSDPEDTDTFKKIILKNTGKQGYHPANEIWNPAGGDTFYSFTHILFSVTSIKSAFHNIPHIPDFTTDLCTEIISKDDRVNILHLMHKLGGFPAGGYGPPISGGIASPSAYNKKEDISFLLEELSRKPEEGGIGLKEADMFTYEMNNCSPELRSMLCSLLKCISDTYKIYQHLMPAELFESLNSAESKKGMLLEKLMKIFNSREMIPEDHKIIFNSIDMQVLSFCSRFLTDNISYILSSYDDKEKNQLFTGDNLELDCSLGKIGIFGIQADTINSNYLLIINTGGNDVYEGNTACADISKLPFSIVIDLEGDDRYGNKSQANVCRSVLGLSMLIDLKGNDKYFSDSHGLSFSLGGFSFLEDSEGNDTYYCKGGYGLASSWFGYSILYDRSGNDIYSSGNYAQGFGGTLGVALLLDAKGNDRYLAEAGSFCQGAARGRWAVAGDGFNMGGGYGILLDKSGDDEYKAKSFSQAASYYMGLGILYDNKGDDKYDAVSHSQGAAIHKTLACFIDNAGNDRYNTFSDKNRISQSMGYGRDRSHAFFTDSNGKDKYVFGNKSFGVGDINASGVALDLSGDDNYLWIKNGRYAGFDSFGSAQSVDSNMIMEKSFFEYLPNTIGIALDQNGDDTYLLMNPDKHTDQFFSDNKKYSNTTINKYSIRRDKK